MRQVVGAIFIAGVIAGCGAAGPPSGGSPAPFTTNTSATGVGSVESPAVGQKYPFVLYTHCGIRSAQFGGRWWVAVTPVEQPHPGGKDETAGTMELVNDDLARFRWQGGSADFTPSAAAPKPPCQ
ncbi:hypothetical protein [[Actinomadura] parvosata]|uniref:hypothetical protein n=1 Tax=[Actinomadura] parvosata TaxID=1955412 RepID=UPI0012BBF5F5|nr:hypothetical protein [Nonomuraea sp. ATCC 55076]